MKTRGQCGELQITVSSLVIPASVEGLKNSNHEALDEFEMK
jgi:hypothetical protein